MKFIKKNKFTLFVIFFFLILFVLLLQAKNLFFPKSDDANYGDRLDGIVEVSKDSLSLVIDKLKENENVLEVTTSISGRIVNVIITVNDDLGIKEAKKIAESSKDSFSEEILKDYDIQLFVMKNSETENNFPIIGYKAKKNDHFTWTKDREKVVEEEEES